jgi:uncharacterized protein DUF4382
MRRVTAVLMLALLTSGACGGSTSMDSPSMMNPTNPSSPSPLTGSRLTLMLKDSPFSDAKALLVTFSEVNVHASGGDWITVPFAAGATSRTCDLKKLQTAQDILGVGTLAAGHYTQLRLVVSRATIYLQDASSGPACAPSISIAASPETTFPVDIPSGEIKLNREFDLTSGAGTMILLDFDGDRSVRLTGNGNGHGTQRYMMTPVIAIVSVN